MLDTCSFSMLPQDEDKPAQKANPGYQRLVHAFAGRAPLPHLSRKYERELITQVQDFSCEESQRILVESHMGFLINIANRFCAKSGLDDHLEDFYSAASIGFLKSIRKFRLKRDQARLSTYARYNVVSACLSYVLKNKYPFRFGTNVSDRLVWNKMGLIRAAFEEVHDRPMRHDMGDAELASKLFPFPARSILRAMSAEQTVNTFAIDDIQIHEPGHARRGETRAIDYSRKDYLEKRVAQIAAVMSARDGDILTSVLGDLDNKTDRLAECAARYGISVERVRQILRAGISEVRSALAADGYHAFSDIA